MDKQLRAALTANCALSFTTGLILAVAPATVAGWLDVDIAGWLRLLGVALIGHGVLLVWAARRPDPVPLGKLNFAAIAPYPLLLVVVILTGLVDRPLGQLLLALDASAVAMIALWHLFALRGAPATAPAATA